MDRRNEIMKDALGIDYSIYEYGNISFDYERMMKEQSFPMEKIIETQKKLKWEILHCLS